MRRRAAAARPLTEAEPPPQHLVDPTVDYWCPEHLRGTESARQAAQDAWQAAYDAWGPSIEGQMLPREYVTWARRASVGAIIVR